jgi:SnoaL-like domain
MTVNTDETTRQNLKRMDYLDFTAWNTRDWDLFRRLHTADVHVEVSGQAGTDGIDAHVKAMKSLMEQTGGQPMQVQSHPIAFGSGEWTCVVGEFANGARMVTVARWHDEAIVEEHIWL